MKPTEKLKPHFLQCGKTRTGVVRVELNRNVLKDKARTLLDHIRVQWSINETAKLPFWRKV